VTDGTRDKVKTRILQYYRLGEHICHVYKHQKIGTQKSYLEFLKPSCGGWESDISAGVELGKHTTLGISNREFNIEDWL